MDWSAGGDITINAGTNCPVGGSHFTQFLYLHGEVVKLRHDIKWCRYMAILLSIAVLLTVAVQVSQCSH